MMRNAALKYLRNLAMIALSLYILLCLLMYLFQDKLLFHPQPRSIAETAAFLEQQPGFDTLGLTMEDGTIISVLLSKHGDGDSHQPLVIYFGGNAEEVSHLAGYKHRFTAGRLALVNYRGFGLSGGRPSEKTMFSDALRIYDSLKELAGMDAEHIIAVGRSIGSGVATYLSSKRPVSATVLITPYESMTAVASEKYPFLPISWLLRHPFASQRYAKDISTPVLALIAKNDAVIPPPHAYALLKHWKGETSFLELDADHNSILSQEAAWKKMEAFIADHSKE